MTSQNDSGRAFEYGLAVSFSRLLPGRLQDGVQIRKAKRCFELADLVEQRKIVKSADEIALFLIAHDNRLVENVCSVFLQSDQEGKHGDVRDIVILNSITREEIGISAKNRHAAVKHSRLSEQIDFGTDWLGIRCSDVYFHQIVPIFRELKSRQRRGQEWNEISDKKTRFYMPYEDTAKGFRS